MSSISFCSAARTFSGGDCAIEQCLGQAGVELQRALDKFGRLPGARAVTALEQRLPHAGQRRGITAGAQAIGALIGAQRQSELADTTVGLAERQPAGLVLRLTLQVTRKLGNAAAARARGRDVGPAAVANQPVEHGARHDQRQHREGGDQRRRRRRRSLSQQRPRQE
jgi:hypothetical protein